MTTLNYTKPRIPALLLITAAFSILGITGIFHHEMWLDEMHHWLLAKESNSLKELFFNIRFEGHPPAWNIILFIITRFTSNPFFMQVTHLVIASVAVLVFLRHAPFSLPFKCLIIFGYYFLYEYQVISRAYGLGLLILWIILALWPRRQQYFILLCFLCGILSQVHLFFLFISLTLFLIQLFDARFSINNIKLVSGIIIYSGFIILALTFIVPEDIYFLSRYNQEPVISMERLKRAGAVFMKSFMHVPDFNKINCWNSNYFFNYNFTLLFIPLCLFICIPFVLFYDNLLCLFLFYLPAFLITAILSLSPLSLATRYFGMIYISFLVSLWYGKISDYHYDGNYYLHFKPFMHKLKKVIEKPFFALLFVTQIISSVIMFAKDYKQPFSQAEKTMRFLDNMNPGQCQYAVSNIAAISSLGGYTHSQLFSLEAGRVCKFWPWNVFPFQFEANEIIPSLTVFSKEIPNPGILISNHLLIFNNNKHAPLLSFKNDTISVNLVKHFNGSLTGGENFYIYRIKRNK